MPARKTKQKASKKKVAARPRRLDLNHLRKTIDNLKKNFEREAKAAKGEHRIETAGGKAAAQSDSRAERIRDDDRKLATAAKSASSQEGKREHARREVLARIAEVRSELANRTAELERRAERLGELMGLSSRQSAGTIQGKG